MSQVPAQRREYKYLFPLAYLDRLERQLAPYCVRDPYAGPDGSYLIRSLYLDTWDYRLFHANDREAPNRYKARVRTYPSRPDSPVFLEIKRRVNDVICKSRVGVPCDDWTAHLRLPDPTVHPDAALSAFLVRLHGHALEPKTLVEYARFAWKGTQEPYARVSVDVGIRSQEKRQLDLEADPRLWRPIDHQVVTMTNTPVGVLELKFAGPPPRWMQNLVQEMELIRQAFSKYCNAIRGFLPASGVRRVRRSA